MLNFLNPDCFPEDILRVLSRHMINPKASTVSDLELFSVLKQYDQLKLLTVSDLNVGELFNVSSGKSFIRGKKIRKRYQCIECSTNQIYLFHPFAEVMRGGIV